MVRKGPKFAGAMRRETHRQLSPHILVSTALFCSLDHLELSECRKELRQM